MNTKELFDLLNHLVARGEQSEKLIEINRMDIMTPKLIQVSVNNADTIKDARVMISGSFINLKGQTVKGMPVEMTLEDAVDFAKGIIAAVEYKARELEGNNGQ